MISGIKEPPPIRYEISEGEFRIERNDYSINSLLSLEVIFQIQNDPNVGPLLMEFDHISRVVEDLTVVLHTNDAVILALVKKLITKMKRMVVLRLQVLTTVKIDDLLPDQTFIPLLCIMVFSVDWKQMASNVLTRKRYIADMDIITAGVPEIPPDHDFYSLRINGEMEDEGRCLENKKRAVKIGFIALHKKENIIEALIHVIGSYVDIKDAFDPFKN